MTSARGWRILLIAAAVFVLDQTAKFLVIRWLQLGHEQVIISGFFKFVHWENPGAAWNLLYGKNGLLAIVSVAALIGLVVWRHQFDTRTWLGQLALGLIGGGILGNLCDRLMRDHVIDFLRFYLYPRGGGEIGFPAFNVADSAICVGVALLIIISWNQDRTDEATIGN